MNIPKLDATFQSRVGNRLSNIYKGIQLWFSVDDLE